MKKQAALLVVLTFGLFTLWVETPWMWAIQQVAVFLLAGWCLWSKQERWPPTLIPLAGPVLICGIQFVFRTTADRWDTTAQLYTWLAWIAAYWIAYSTVRDEEGFLRRVQWIGIVIAVLAILHRTTSHGKAFWMFETGRPMVMGVFPYENQYAAFILLVLPGTLLRAQRDGPNRFSWLAGAAVMVASVISSSSVAGAALVVLETVAIASLQNQWNWKNRIVLACGILGCAAAFGSVSGWRDIVSDLERHNALETRRQLTLSTIEMARDRPLTGWGMGTWTELYPAYARFDDGVFDNAAHNDWAQWRQTAVCRCC